MGNATVAAGHPVAAFAATRAALDAILPPSTRAAATAEEAGNAAFAGHPVAATLHLLRLQLLLPLLPLLLLPPLLLLLLP